MLQKKNKRTQKNKNKTQPNDLKKNEVNTMKMTKKNYFSNAPVEASLVLFLDQSFE